jgi:hypothetical protein
VHVRIEITEILLPRVLKVAGAIDCVAEKIVELVDEMEALAGKLDAIVDPGVVLGDP